jgi:hypothetical protein
MHSLITHHRPKPITLLYVKSVPNIYSIRSIFGFARTVEPCLLIIEDIDTQITPDKLSYFFNEVDGLENNDGILMIATTNHLDKLDEGLKRPSRFDRRYVFPLPRLAGRTQYAEFWRKKLDKNGAKVEFPKPLSSKIAGITSGFSFATMKEAFISTLLSLARNGDDKTRDTGHDDIDDLPLWKEMQIQVKLLRKEMEKSKSNRVSPPPSRLQKYIFQDRLDMADTDVFPCARDPPPPQDGPSAPVPYERLTRPFPPEHPPFFSRSTAHPGSWETRSSAPDVQSQAEAGLLRESVASMEIGPPPPHAAYPAVPMMVAPGLQLVPRNSLGPRQEFQGLLRASDIHGMGPWGLGH